MIRATHLQCKECAARYPAGALYVCERCFGPLEVVLPAPTAEIGELRKRIAEGPASLWRYRDFLPFSAPPAGALSAGMTPLVPASRLAERLGVAEVWIKNDAANPTHSFKDRVVSMALAAAHHFGMKHLACASTGNLAGAVAAHAAALGMPFTVLVPATLEEQKITASRIYGNGVVKVNGSYDDINRLCTELAGERDDWGFVNINLRPYYSEGSKTLAYEVAEQLGYRTPDRVIAPIASGSLYTKISAAFDEWLDLGLLYGPRPVMHGAQGAGCAPVAEAFAQAEDRTRPVKPSGSVSSLAIGNPADGPYALRVARSTGGTIEGIPDSEMRAGVRLLAETTGIFCEAAGGVTTALLSRLAERGELRVDERIVLYITGSGLKTPDAPGLRPVPTIEPTLAAAAELT